MHVTVAGSTSKSVTVPHGPGSVVLVVTGNGPGKQSARTRIPSTVTTLFRSHLPRLVRRTRNSAAGDSPRSHTRIRGGRPQMANVHTPSCLPSQSCGNPSISTSERSGFPISGCASRGVASTRTGRAAAASIDPTCFIVTASTYSRTARKTKHGEELRQAAQQELAGQGLEETPPVDAHPHKLVATSAATPATTAAGGGSGKYERAFPVGCLVGVAGGIAVVASDSCPSSRRCDWLAQHTFGRFTAGTPVKR